MANRTIIVDNNTWNTSHIATVGRAMSSPELKAWKIYRSLDVVSGGLCCFSTHPWAVCTVGAVLCCCCALWAAILCAAAAAHCGLYACCASRFGLRSWLRVCSELCSSSCRLHSACSCCMVKSMVQCTPGKPVLSGGGGHTVAVLQHHAVHLTADCRTPSHAACADEQYLSIELLPL